MNLEPGQIFAKDFRVERRLSQGGMGAVYVARQLSTDKLRALKVMLPGLLPDAKSRGRFVEEARIGGRIESEHVVEVVAAGLEETSGAPWLAMELLEGEDLAALVSRRGALPAGEVREVFVQVGHALGAAHAQGIVHRDLKPENLFLARSRRVGQASLIKVLDFGIAVAVPSGGMGVVTTAVGSPLWMAPEQSRPGDSLLPSTDVWALGLIAFHLLTGRSYWRTARHDDVSIGAVLTEILVEPLEPATARAAEAGAAARLPDGFDAWFARCVTRTASERFADATAALGGLDALLAPLGERTPVAFSTPQQQPQPVVQAAGLDATFQRATPFLGDTAASAPKAPMVPRVPPAAPAPPVASQAPPARRRMPIGFFVGVAGVALAAFAFWGRQPPPPAATVDVIAQPTVASPVVVAPPQVADAGHEEIAAAIPGAGSPVDAGTPSAVAAPASGTPLAVAAPEQPIRPQIPVRPRPVAAPKPAAPVPGTLSIIASQPSSVTIDGAKVGTTPLELPVAPGGHVVIVSNAEFKFTERYELAVYSDRMTPLMVTVTPPPPSHWVVKGRVDSKTYAFDALSYADLKDQCYAWFKTHFPKKGPTKMTANGGEWPQESSPMQVHHVCSYVLKNVYVEPGTRSP